jgi:outer membrane protein OmpU
MDGYARFGLKYTSDIDQTEKNAAEQAAQIEAVDAWASVFFSEGTLEDIGSGDLDTADLSLDAFLGSDGYEARTFENGNDIIDYIFDAQAAGVAALNQLVVAQSRVADDADLIVAFDPETGAYAALDELTGDWEEVTDVEGAFDDLAGAVHEYAFYAEHAQAVLAAAGAAVASDAVKSMTQITSRFRLNINASATADSGMTLGAMVRMQADASNPDDTAGEAGLNGAQFYLQTGGLKVSVGNICGPLECMPGQYAASVGLTGLGYENVVTNFAHDYYSSTGAGVNGVQVDYTVGEFALAVSHGEATGNTGVVLAYNGEQFGLALGMQDGDTAAEDITMATAYVNFGGGQLNAAVSDNNGDMKWRVGGSYDVAAATTLTGYVTQDDAQFRDDTGYGIGISHSLGGGVSLRAGFVHSTADYNVADFGMFFSF